MPSASLAYFSGLSSDISIGFLSASFPHFTAPHLFKSIRFFHFGRNVDVDDSVSALPLGASDCFKRFENPRALSLCGGSTDTLKVLDLNLTPLVAAPHLRKLCVQTWCLEDDASGLRPYSTSYSRLTPSWKN
ncbi:hypothetical protein BDN71DRAFT_1504458 [Pleurotus eryngii]|uniref:Uncharacterized protein n=1 Tax=Pleurotus eryngii TaxID=5323 RepID=A0A9P6A0R3_PLEER|nr:hypothetical protein BDN71DRAFT_1504458 [Pleurotus eryngii]